MSERKELGCIKKCHFGHGGDQDAQIGISFDLGGEGWGVGDFWGAWAIKWYEQCQWTEESRIKELGTVCMQINELLQKAKCQSVEDLPGTPIEVTFDGNLLRSWRVLTEVLR